VFRLPTIVVACLAGVALLLAAAPADACTCATGPTSCRELSTADAVFEATVESLEAEPPGVTYSSARLRRITLSDLKALRGTPEATIVTPWSSASCGYEFKPGVRYLVVAHRGADGRLAVYMCGQTVPLAYARSQLAYLETLGGPQDQTRVWGGVYRTPTQYWPDFAPTPVAGAIVTLKGPAEETVTSDAQGRFLVTGLPRGAYSVEASIASGATVIQARPDRFSWKPDEAFACAAVGLSIPTTGRISGSMRNEFGESISGAMVSLHAVDPATSRPGARLTATLTDEHGGYTFSELPPGSYMATLNWLTGPTFSAPHAAAIARASSGSEVIVLGQDEALALAPLQLERLAAITVEGIVRDRGGAPVGGARVGGWGIHHGGARYPLASPVVSAADGTFKLVLWRGERYVIDVEAGGRRASAELVASASPITIALPQ
jgi:hypothetical protein